MGISVENSVGLANVAFSAGAASPCNIDTDELGKYLERARPKSHGKPLSNGNPSKPGGSRSERRWVVTDDEGEDEDEDEDEDEEEHGEFPVDWVADYGVDPRDEGTADNWVKRHPDLVRLTGRHPFNCEPPLQRLMSHGFLTPTSLHYVRNHGYVPHAALQDWKVEVTGLVKRPQTFSMSQIMEEFPHRELPVTLVCAGNRRKEQNMVKQTIGFNWGSAGIGTSVWRGARLCDILRKCGVYSKKRGALYVTFEGKETLPAAGGTKYGTGITIDIAMDEARDVLVAYSQNGKPLEPDHGFPVRIIIPGFIGGRMVKWLTRIHVGEHESNNHYHYHDNRVLPSHVDAEVANAEGWWFKSEYLINDLNINSVLTTPSHAQVLAINTVTLQAPYAMKGYAYTGGGRKVTRVEVTIDNGLKWRLCEIDYPEKPTKYGKYWCWCFWSLNIEVMELMQAKEIAVRAWDESMNTQPQKLTWNAMGMMNNCWFRVHISPCKTNEGGLGLIFEHPTRPGNQNGGWMSRTGHDIHDEKVVASTKPSLTKSLSSPFLGQTVRQITMAEVRKHNTQESPWIVVRNKVYDCKGFLKEHPGGADSILINAGTDCTEEFEAIHSDKAKHLLEDFKIGELANYGNLSADSTPEGSIHDGNLALSMLQHAPLFPISEVPANSKPVALVDPKLKISCTLLEKRAISHDVRVFRFGLPSVEQVLGLPLGKHIFLLARINGKLCMRAYTPTTSDDDDDVVGYFELVVKVYFKGVHPRFPEGGLMSQYLDGLDIGDKLDVKGPLGGFHYTGRGHFSVEGKPKFMKRCSMLAGGTGITPMYQILKAILRDPHDSTEVSLVFANRTEEDIILREELDAWAQEHPSRFKVWYVVEKAREGWPYSTGFITEEVLRANLPSGDSQTMALMCGPPPMIQFACLPNLEKLGYENHLCFQF